MFGEKTYLLVEGMNPQFTHSIFYTILLKYFIIVRVLSKILLFWWIAKKKYDKWKFDKEIKNTIKFAGINDFWFEESEDEEVGQLAINSSQVSSAIPTE